MIYFINLLGPNKACDQTKEKSDTPNISENSEIRNIDSNANVSAKVQKIINSIPDFKEGKRFYAIKIKFS